MSYYYGGWAVYVSVAERRRKAEAEIKKLRQNGAVISPVKIDGRKIAKTFWGQAWCDNLESYRDYENRLPRGRTYVRNGSVLDLQIAPREVTARVSGSELYQVKVSIADVAKTRWKKLCTDCSGGIDSLVELLQGRFSKGVMERICQQEAGLFPRPSEIRFTCSCPDYASMCKHIAAVLYGVGARLDESPELLFRLRAVEATELLSNLGNALPATQTPRDTAQTLADADLAALFDLDMAADELPAPPPDVVPSSRIQKPTRNSNKSLQRSPAASQAVKTKTKTAKSAVKTKSETATIKAKPKTAKPATKAEPITSTSKSLPKPAKLVQAAQAALNKLANSRTAKVPTKAKTAMKVALTKAKPKAAKPATKAEPTTLSPKTLLKPAKRVQIAKAAPNKVAKSRTAKVPTKAKTARAAPIKAKPKAAKPATKAEPTTLSPKTRPKPAKQVQTARAALNKLGKKPCGERVD